jgi:hypothetical protein
MAITMNIQVEINGEPYTGSAFNTKDGILIQLSGVQVPLAPPFEAMFRGIPEHKLNGGFLEVGEWNGKEFSFETQIAFGLGPDGKVWAKICETPAELPDAGFETLTTLESASNSNTALSLTR